MKKQQTVRGIPHWGKFKDAVRDMRNAVGVLLENEMPQHAQSMDYLAETIERGMKFYVPDVRNIISGKDLHPPFDGKEYVPFRLPYPITILLSTTHINNQADGIDTKGATRIKIPDAPEKIDTHKISILVQKQEEGEDLDIRCASVLYAPHLKVWACQPAFCKFSFKPEDIGAHRAMGYGLDWNPDPHTVNFIEYLVDHGNSQEEIGDILSDYQDDFMSMATLCNLLEINDCKQVPVNVPPKLAKKHAKRGETANYDYKVLSIGGEVWDSPYLGGGNGGGGGAKRSHMRRGHIRTYQNGKKVWINSTYVHGNREGFVEKDYRLKGGGDAE